MRAIRPVLVIVALALALAGPGQARAASPSDQLRAGIDRVVVILEDATLRTRPQARREALRAAAAGIFDYPETTRRSLGRHWQAATPAQREELVQAFTGRLERAYLSRLEQYRGERIVVSGESIDADLATVRTRVIAPSGVETPIDYRLHRAGDRWLAYDVSVEGVSLVASYRTQFNRIIQTSSAQALVQRLRATQE